MATRVTLRAWSLRSRHGLRHGQVSVTADVWQRRIAPLLFLGYLFGMTTQFLTDQEGKRVAVVLPIEDFDELMEDLSDLATVAERSNEERVTLEQVKQRLIADGLLSR